MVKKRSSTLGEQSETGEFERERLKFKLNILQRDDLTEKQRDFIKLTLRRDTKVIFLAGCAGTSKTYISVLSSLILLNSKKINDILYIRGTAESGAKSLGYLPGMLNEKFKPYLMPLEDKLGELLNSDDINYLHNDRRISGAPINYMRGASFNDKVIIADEAQNFNIKELTTLMTRLGENNKMFIIGDFMQSDIGGRTGFKSFYDAFNTEESAERGIHCFEFGKEDIVRSELLTYIIDVIEGNFHNT